MGERENREFWIRQTTALLAMPINRYLYISFLCIVITELLRVRQNRLSNCFSVISFRACREGFLQLFFPAGQVQVLPAG